MSPAPPSVFSLAGAFVQPSPRISVVMPCVTLLTMRPSPVRKSSREWLWMSMNPGATTSPRASTRSRARARREHPDGGDARDAVAADADVAVEPGASGPVHDPAARDDDVVRRGIRSDAARG